MKGGRGRRGNGVGTCGGTCRETYPSPFHPHTQCVLFLRPTLGDLRSQTTASRSLQDAGFGMYAESAAQVNHTVDGDIVV
jgi:hypothetical protein